MRIAIHSTTDKITNSSTVIYTYADGSVKVFKELINEMFKTLDMKERCEDVFDVSVQVDQDRLNEYIEERLEELESSDDEPISEDLMSNDYDVSHAAFELLLKDIKSKKVKKPKWFLEMEQEFTDDDNEGYPPESFLEVTAKDPKYEPLAKLLVKFLYSTNHEATRDG